METTGNDVLENGKWEGGLRRLALFQEGASSGASPSSSPLLKRVFLLPSIPEQMLSVCLRFSGILLLYISPPYPHTEAPPPVPQPRYQIASCTRPQISSRYFPIFSFLSIDRRFCFWPIECAFIFSRDNPYRLRASEQIRRGGGKQRRARSRPHRSTPHEYFPPVRSPRSRRNFPHRPRFPTIFPSTRETSLSFVAHLCIASRAAAIVLR